MHHNVFQITGWTEPVFFFLADIEHYPSSKYNTKECVIHFWLSALVMTVKYISDLASSE